MKTDFGTRVKWELCLWKFKLISPMIEHHYLGWRIDNYWNKYKWKILQEMIKLGGNFYHHMCSIEGRVFSIQAGEYFVDQEIFWNFSVIAKNIPVNKIFIDLQKYFSPQLTFCKISVITIIIRFSKYLLISNSQN